MAVTQVRGKTQLKFPDRVIVNRGSADLSLTSDDEGLLLYRTDLDQLRVFDGSAFKVVGALGVGTKVYAETVNETPNSILTEFTVDSAYLGGSTLVTRNGLLQERGVDYTEQSELAKITFTVPPLTGSIISVSYAVESGSQIYGEKVNETPNGILTAFTTDNAYVSNSTFVTVNGLLQERSVDYTESGSNQITFTAAPLTGATILVTYVRTPGGEVRIYSELTNETPNGVLTIFTVDAPYLSNTTLVTRNGVFQERGVEYTEQPSLGQITFTSAPPTGSIILVSYTTSFSIGLHAPSHAGAGSDPITSLGAHTLTGSITPDADAVYSIGTDSFRLNTIRAQFVESGDMTFANKWKLTEAENFGLGEGLLLMSPDGRKFKFQLEEVVEGASASSTKRRKRSKGI